MATNTKTTDYQLHLKGFVGGYDFDADYVDYILNKNKDSEVHVLIDSLGGRSNTALSIFSAFKRHGNVNVHFVGMNASAATIASLGARLTHSSAWKRTTSSMKANASMPRPSSTTITWPAATSVMIATANPRSTNKGTKKEGLTTLNVCQSFLVSGFKFQVSECDWSMPHATGCTQCRQGCCQYRHNHLNDGLPCFLFHSIRFLRVNTC